MQKLLNKLWPLCPSGFGHRVRGGTVTNAYGSTYCWHPDCVRANRREVEEREASAAALRDAEALEKLSQAIQKAVRQAILEERRPGGLLYRERPNRASAKPVRP